MTPLFFMLLLEEGWGGEQGFPPLLSFPHHPGGSYLTTLPER